MPAEGVTLAAEDWKDKEAAYRFGANVTFDSGQTVAAGDVGGVKNNPVTGFAWSVSPAEGASVTNAGELTVTEAGAYTVTCSALGADGSALESAAAKVEAEKAADDDGKAEEVDAQAEVWITGASSDGAHEVTEEDKDAEVERASDADAFPSFDFTGHVRVFTKNGDDSVSLLEYSTADGSLNEKTKELEKEKNITGAEFNDVEWVLTDSNGDEVSADAATLDGGKLEVKQDGVYKVICRVTSAGGEFTKEDAVEVKCVTAGKDLVEDDQDIHQDSLHVVVNAPASAVSDEVLAGLEGDSAESAEGSSSSGESASEGSSGSSSSSSSGDKVVQFDVTYQYSEDGSGELNSLEASRSTYAMTSYTRGSVEVVGEGPTLQSVLEKAGITDMRAVEQVKFVDYSKLADSAPVVEWSALGDAMVAFKSNYASAAGSSASESASGEGAGSEGQIELLPNDRFHVLYDMGSSSGIDGDGLRYIQEIVVNPNLAPTPKPDPTSSSSSSESTNDNPEIVAPFTVSIDAVWAPSGEAAVLMPVPSRELEGTFDYLWQESTDGGKTWNDVYDGQIYWVKVTETSCNMVRVKVRSTMMNPMTGKAYEAVSLPLVLQYSEGFIAQLEYDPPLAGDVALFQVKVIDTVGDVNKNKLDYVWEVSEDGMKTWQKLASKYQGNSTLKLPTQKIDESQVESSGSKLSYIRCTVVETTGKKRSRTTNAQGFTVRFQNSETAQTDSTSAASAKSLDKAKVAAISDKAWTGKSIKPSPKVTLGGKTLKKGVDYTLSYKGNKSLGLAKVTVKGKGSYAGTKTVAFRIVPAKVTGVKARSAKRSSVTVSWSAKLAKKAGASGYRIYYKIAGKKTCFVNVKSTGRSSCTIGNLARGKKVTVKVQAYVNINGKKAYGAWSAAKSARVKR